MSHEDALLPRLLLGGGSTALACIFTNPIECIKTKQQVQGESSGRQGKRPYRNFFQAFFTVAKVEGVRGLQKGLVPGMGYQFMMNGARLGTYPTFQHVYGSLLHVQDAPKDDVRLFARNLAAGATSGALGAFVGSPLFMLKVRYQTASSAQLAVGHQHAYSGVLSALRQVVREEGVRGLMRGVTAAVPRVMIGSAVQLSTYDRAKQLLVDRVGLDPRLTSTHFAGSLLSGLAVTVAMNPADVLSTRLYNQPAGEKRLYSGVLDCLAKTVKHEGVTALYKGFLAHYLRLGPHTILTFVFWEKAKQLAGYQ